MHQLLSVHEEGCSRDINMEIHGNDKGHGDISGTPMPSAIAYVPNVLLSDFKFSHSEIAILGRISKIKIKCHLTVPCLGLNWSKSIY